MQKGFQCQNCNFNIKTIGNIGTKNRNHCPKCLFSKHVDEIHSGDRASDCQSLMEPIGLTFKKSRIDKYGKEIQGELMLVHKCKNCKKVSINRIAADDDSKKILEIFEDSIKKEILDIENIRFLKEKDRAEIEKQLFGV